MELSVSKFTNVCEWDLVVPPRFRDDHELAFHDHRVSIIKESVGSGLEAVEGIWNGSEHIFQDFIGAVVCTRGRVAFGLNLGYVVSPLIQKRFSVSSVKCGIHLFNRLDVHGLFGCHKVPFVYICTQRRCILLC